jgi:hypothetical protein
MPAIRRKGGTRMSAAESFGQGTPLGVTLLLSQQSPRSSALIEQAVFGLDRWLRQRQGVLEFSDHPQCLFRIQPAKADAEVLLADGTRVAQGATLLNLHLWNEHVPAIGAEGATLQWARAVSRAIDLSLNELARHLGSTPSLDDVAALRADMRLGTVEQGAQLARLAARYGFQPACGTGAHAGDTGTVQRLAENMFILLLVLATNPAAFGTPVLRRDHTLVYLSRLALEQRYAVTDGRRGNRGATLC